MANKGAKQFGVKPGTSEPKPEPKAVQVEVKEIVEAEQDKPVIKTNSFKAPKNFRLILNTVIANHPDFKNTKEFLISCFRRGLEEISDVEVADPVPNKFSTTKLSDNIAKELNDFLNKNTVEEVVSGPREADIVCLMDMSFFLELKSKVTLSKYKELRVFYIHQIYKGLNRLLIE